MKFKIDNSGGIFIRMQHCKSGCGELIGFNQNVIGVGFKDCGFFSIIASNIEEKLARK